MLATDLVYSGEALPEGDARQCLGAKAARLLEVAALGYRVPRFYIITKLAWEASLKAGSLSTAQTPAPAGAGADALMDAGIPPAVRQAIIQAHQQFAGPVAVRSSAVAEDGVAWSYAGIFETVLGVDSTEGVLQAVHKVWMSAFEARAVSYRQNIPDSQDTALAVVVQQMVDADSSGVMFTCSPAGDPHVIMIHALPGLGAGLVEMNLPCDTYLVDKKSGAVDAKLSVKTEQVVLDRQRGGTVCVPVESDRQNAFTLSTAQVDQLLRVGMELERHFARPQDIEFCFDQEGRLHLLQARPVTGLPGAGQTAGNHLVWDNSNIVESYRGVTSPMTFSFVRRAYAIVYQCFLELMGVPATSIKANRRTAENMLGLFRGRIYYNLKNWYRLLKLFPGFQYNSRFMETMMGVGESLSLEDGPVKPRSWLKRWFVDLPALLQLLIRSAWNFHRIDSIVEGFQSHFRGHYAVWSRIDYSRLKPHEALALYQEMEDALLWKWRAPILADFYSMIFHGLLRKLCKAWCEDNSGSLANELMCGEGGIESAEPAHRLLQLTRVAAANEELRALILSADLKTLSSHLHRENRFGEFRAAFAAYLAEFGFRCADELKLEEPSLSEQPWMLLKMVRDYLAIDRHEILDTEAIARRDLSLRRTAEQRVGETLSRGRWRLFRRRVFRWVLGAARRGVRHRENMRFARTRIYGLFRQMLKATGGHLAAKGRLDSADDVFFLTIEELWDYVRGTAVTTDLKGLVRLRRAEFERYRRRDEPEPDARFETRGLPYYQNPLRNSDAPPTDSPGMLHGTGCCPGEVEGEVCVVHDPTEAGHLAGRILVAERTDPGWVPLYPAVSGILVERGSLLSHSAVVARELGIPTIVGIRGLTRALRTGQRVRMDGRHGTVEILTDDETSTDFIEPEGCVEERPVASQQAV